MWNQPYDAVDNKGEEAKVVGEGGREGEGEREGQQGVDTTTPLNYGQYYDMNQYYAYYGYSHPYYANQAQDGTAQQEGSEAAKLVDYGAEEQEDDETKEEKKDTEKEEDGKQEEKKEDKREKKEDKQ